MHASELENLEAHTKRVEDKPTPRREIALTISRIREAHRRRLEAHIKRVEDPTRRQR